MKSSDAHAVVIVANADGKPEVFPIRDRLMIGRECAGMDDEHRVIVTDPIASREHAEIRIRASGGSAVLIDLSVNGTRVNGVRVERAVPVRLAPGDRITVGNTDLEFQMTGIRATTMNDHHTTLREVSTTNMALVVGDVVGYSTLSEDADEQLVAATLDALYGGLRSVLTAHHGILSAYVGDALFAIWEMDQDAHAIGTALHFACEAHQAVRRLAPELPLKNVDHSPIRMGWGVVVGSVAIATLAGDQVSVIGDAANLAFRLSGLAGRDGRPSILATDAVVSAVEEAYQWSAPLQVGVKGRRQPLTVYGLD